MFRLAARTYLRYVAPLTLLGALACAPLLVGVLVLAPTVDAPHARFRLGIGVALAVFALVGQLATVAAAAPALRSLAAGTPLAQTRALSLGARQLACAYIPVLVAFAAVLLGVCALVVPGLALLVLLALTGASERVGEPLPAPLADSVALVRPMFWRIAAIVGIALIVNLVIADGGQLALFGVVPKKNPSIAVSAAMKMKLWVPLALAAVSPLVGCLLAACAAKRR